MGLLDGNKDQINPGRMMFQQQPAPATTSLNQTQLPAVQGQPQTQQGLLNSGGITTTTGAGGIDTSIYNMGDAPVAQQATATTVDPATIATVAAPVMAAPTPIVAKTAEVVNAEWMGYDPTLISKEQQAEMMVDQQMGKYLDPESAINKQVIAAAKDEGAQRGMLNSGMTTGNAMSAMTKLAAQLGTQDANTIYNVAVQNMGAENAAKEFTADAFNRASIANATNATNVNIANAGFENDTARFNAEQATEILKANTANALQANIINAEQANAVAKLNAELLTSTDLSNVQSANAMAAMVFEMATQTGLANAGALNTASLAAADNATRIDAANISANASVASASISAAATIASAEMRAASDAAALALNQEELDVMQRAGFADDFISIATSAQADINNKAGDPIAQQAAADSWTSIAQTVASVAGASTTVTNADGSTVDLIDFGTYFDAESYMAINDDVAGSGMTAEQHYAQFGQTENRVW